MWHPTADTFPAPMEPWLSRQGAFHLFDATWKALAERKFCSCEGMLDDTVHSVVHELIASPVYNNSLDCV